MSVKVREYVVEAYGRGGWVRVPNLSGIDAAKVIRSAKQYRRDRGYKTRVVYVLWKGGVS